ncbi:hypothetical protein F4802DRAFT_618804 [Xylaria palmicola]|nr:hypothetical protein F4802DRAFT_618804 [Xylaria palmicola]
MNRTEIGSVATGPIMAFFKRKTSEVQEVDLPVKKQRTQPGHDSTLPKPQMPTSSGSTPFVPFGRPPVSANFRAALCDSVNFWKAHQGGIHSHLGVATGMLLTGTTTPRDVLQAQVVVTTVGGALKAGSDGKLVRNMDHPDKCQNYVVLKRALELGQPIGMVVGKKSENKCPPVNNLLDVALTYRYNVLDWFFITEIWSEYQPTQHDGTQFKQYMVRLQKINLDSISWWAAQGAERKDMHPIGDVQCHLVTCTSCQMPSKEIFTEGWCCLKKDCPMFFNFADPNVDFDKLQYNESFLNERTPWISSLPLKDLVPKLPSIGKGQCGSEECFKDGIVCPNCRVASRRASWEGWRCENGCGFELLLPPRDVGMERIHREVAKLHKKKPQKFHLIDARIRRTEHKVSGYKATSFYLPNAPGDLNEAAFIGSVTVFEPTKTALERDGGLNDLFDEIQKVTREGDVKLRRNPAFCKGSHMEELTSHFSCNMGADYKFGVAVETSNGFDTAPAPVMKALSRLTWGGAKAVDLTASHVEESHLSVDDESMPSQFIDFNEQLMLGYFQGSQIGYHDDGEKELGPTVATLSLGSPSTMRFRGKKKVGFENTAKGRVMLSFNLEHGDMVVMHGTKIHKVYEHCVGAHGVRRYALTCRYIRPEMIPDPERREKAIVRGAVPPYWRQQAYNGEPC